LTDAVAGVIFQLLTELWDQGGDARVLLSSVTGNASIIASSVCLL